jgi:hypothetical protein
LFGFIRRHLRQGKEDLDIPFGEIPGSGEGMDPGSLPSSRVADGFAPNGSRIIVQILLNTWYFLERKIYFKWGLLGPFFNKRQWTMLTFNARRFQMLGDIWH